MQCVSSRRDRYYARMTLAFLPLLSIASSSFFLFNIFPGWQAYSAHGLLFLANLLLLVCVYLLIWVKPLREQHTEQVSIDAALSGAIEDQSAEPLPFHRENESCFDGDRVEVEEKCIQT